MKSLQSYSLSFGNLIWLTNIESWSILKAEPTDRTEKEYEVHFLVPEKNSASPYEGLWLVESEVKETGVI